MRNLCEPLLALACAAVLLSLAAAQPPGAGRRTTRTRRRTTATSPIVVKMMAFDKKKDGKLTKDEMTDERLLRLFDQADANKDGVVTKEELMALAAKLEAEAPDARPPAALAGFGGPATALVVRAASARRGPGGPGGFGPPQPGQSCRRSSWRS